VSGSIIACSSADLALNGLKNLEALAVVGAARFRKQAATPVDWTWRDFIVRGTTVVLAGPSSEGKTTLLFLALLARATTGAPIVLCGREVKPAPVGQYIVLIEAEHGELSTARKLVKSAGVLGLGDEALDRIIGVSRKDMRLGSDAWRDVERLIARGAVSDLAIDTLARFNDGDANAEKAQVETFEALAKAIERAPSPETQPTVWVVAHTRKGAAASLDDVSGSSQRVAQADTVLMVNAERDGNNRVIASTVSLLKAREEPEDWPEPHTLAIVDGVLASGGRDGGTPLPSDLSALQKRVIEFVRKQKEPRALNYIAKALARSGTDTRDALEALAERGLVREVLDAGQYNGRPFDGWIAAGHPTELPTSSTRLVRPTSARPSEGLDSETSRVDAVAQPTPTPDEQPTPTPDELPASLEGMRGSGPNTKGKT